MNKSTEAPADPEAAVATEAVAAPDVAE